MFSFLRPRRRVLRVSCAVALIGASGLVGAQTSVPDLPAQPFRYEPDLPAFFFDRVVIGQDNTPPDNPITDDGATLGRVLFYDRGLSRNSRVSCASCHLQSRGFADGVRFSVGFEGGRTRRNAMTLTDARFYRRGRFFWDERAGTLEAQVLMPFLDPVEMGLDPNDLVARVALTPFYRPLFRAAFGDTKVTPDRISRALAQFIRSLVSYRSRYDVGRAQVARDSERFPNFTDQENLGRALFLGRGRCVFCHTSDTFASFIPRNNGLDDASTDEGVGAVTGQPADRRSFKAPSLRNIALTAPYMHDGRFETLEQVVDFYSSGIKNDETLDAVLRAFAQPRQLNLTADEKAALVAFLHTLTDFEMAVDPRFSDPFPGR
jgi:cytochrome c peroxidase